MGCAVSEQRLIKKYPNRRLYDTEESRYITLADVQRLMLNGTDVQVIDTQSGDDITRGILIQIITEQEAGGNPLFTTDMLTRFIRFYDESAQDAFSSFLEQTLKLYSEQEEQLRAQMDHIVSGPAVDTWTELAERNMDLWREMQNSFLQTAGLKPGKPSSRPRNE